MNVNIHKIMYTCKDAHMNTWITIFDYMTHMYYIDNMSAGADAGASPGAGPGACPGASSGTDHKEPSICQNGSSGSQYRSVNIKLVIR
eukprot:12410726-Karenia_brevis.AAC.1